MSRRAPKETLRASRTDRKGGSGARTSGVPAQTLGVVAWFKPGDRDGVERALEAIARLGVRSIRLGVSWADGCTEDGQAWYGWLLPRLASAIEIIPCFAYTPPYIAVQPKKSAPPRDPKAYADFLDVFVTRFGDHFEWVELWDEPNNIFEWDARLDPDLLTLCTMLGGAAHWMRQRGKKTLLGGMSPIDPHWLRLMFDRGVMQYIDAVGLHGFPGTREASWSGWRAEVARVQEVLDAHQSKAEIWISETGFSTWRNDQRGQLRTFLDALDAPVARVYWYALDDLDPSLEATSGFHADEREYHFGLRRADATPKLLYRLWADEGVPGIRDVYRLSAPVSAARTAERPILVTGGAGFIGCNVADRWLSQGRRVVLLDDLARPGVEANVRWLRERHGDRVHLELGDVRDRFAIRRALADAEAVFHFAAQVAVTTSLVDPIGDAEINVGGTLRLLEAIRALDRPPPLFFTSTNKVYGALPDVEMRIAGDRYEPVDENIRARGVSESRPLDLHSPYGCSKGAADQYVLDYARTFGLDAVVFRMSCIYGPRQLGTEDQGWVAHFLMRAIEGAPITIYGDGLQVRDVLFVDDLVDAFFAAHASIDRVRGHAFNVGGGPANTTSLRELLALLARLRGVAPETTFEDWRPGDQRYYVSDTAKLARMTGWAPKVGVEEGVSRLHRWLCDVSAPASGGRMAAAG